MNKLKINLSWLPLRPGAWEINWPKLVDLNYILVPNAGSSFRYYSQFVILFSLFLVGSVFISFWRRRFKIVNPPKFHFLNRLLVYLFSFGLTGLILLFMRFENAKLLSSRIVFILAIISFLIWGGRLAYEYLRKLPLLEKSYQTQLLKQKYLPRRRAKKS